MISVKNFQRFSLLDMAVTGIRLVFNQPVITEINQQNQIRKATRPSQCVSLKTTFPPK